MSIKDNTISLFFSSKKNYKEKLWPFNRLIGHQSVKINPKKIDLIIIGLSAGGVEILNQLIPSLKFNFSIPIVVVLHRSKLSDNFLINNLNEKSKVIVKSAEDDEIIKPGFVYFVPPDSHLKFGDHNNFLLCDDPPVNFSRPSIDVTFASAAVVLKKRALGIIMTGASFDGCIGLKRIKDAGGFVIAQNPDEAEISVMPSVAMKVAKVDLVLKLDQLIHFLSELDALKMKNKKRVILSKNPRSLS